MGNILDPAFSAWPFLSARRGWPGDVVDGSVIFFITALVQVDCGEGATWEEFLRRRYFVRSEQVLIINLNSLSKPRSNYGTII